MDRTLPKSLLKHWKDPKNLIQIILGPRQVGKTTAITTLMDKENTIYATADLPIPPTTDFIITQWEEARKLRHPQKILILDEVQKIPRWSETIKMLWDEDIRIKNKMTVWLLGSSAILIEKGLSESLTGRFELNYFPHWIYSECKKIFNASLEDFVFFGGYPKAYSFRDDKERGHEYIQNSIVETTLGRDILTLHAVDKPALLRQLFWYISKLPAQIVSFEKILSHLQGKGNSATLVHYAELLHLAFILTPLSKFSKKIHKTKKSIPKWILPNPALVDISVRKEGLQSFVFENLVGSHIANLLFGNHRYILQYWREDNQEIDFIITENNRPVLAIEVKSGRYKKTSTKLLNDIQCPFTIIHQKNIENFLSTSSIEEILSFYKAR